MCYRAASRATRVAKRSPARSNVLPPRDRRVLTLYFGLEGNRPMTLQEIARELGVTRERVRQLRDRALKRLRESDTAGVLKDGMAA